MLKDKNVTLDYHIFNRLYIPDLNVTFYYLIYYLVGSSSLILLPHNKLLIV